MTLAIRARAAALYRRPAVALLALSLLPLAWLELLQLVNGAPCSWWGALQRWIFVVAMLLAGRADRQRSARPVLLGAGLLGAAAYAALGATLAAWLLLASWLVGLLWAERRLSAGRARLLAWPLRLALAAAAGLVPVALGQIEARFADEEFFAALDAAALSVFWLILLAAHLRPVPERSPAPRLAQILSGTAVLAISLGVLGYAVAAYQQSFFPPEAPAYPGISPAQPMICGTAPPDQRVDAGADVFRRLLARIDANPTKEAPEYALLALARGDEGLAQSFRAALLAEARAGMFTGPAGSVKSVQYDAAQRVFYYVRARERFPSLFSAAEQEELRGWFWAINRRALTVEPVDWTYALAFAKLPEGPYENQENGAALLAILETSALAAPDLHAANQEYLARNRRGWAQRFRNTDDAPIYQPDWIRNALLQAAYTGDLDRQRQRLAFEWLLAQALPDGAAMRQNHPVAFSLADISYLGGRLLDDPRFIWLAARALDDLERSQRYLAAQVVNDQPTALRGRSPDLGSCLIYGDSGLPNQVGPLAPDKIIFRDGWGDTASYLMLNLRFSGWHRYKATNTLTLAYQGGPLLFEELSGQSFAWLPKGRSLFRDKRIPRENLNGLLITRSGLSAVIATLSGAGGPWAQDPPYYARVERFVAGSLFDTATTLIEGWRGWTQRRTVYFYHQGPTVILDTASGPSGSAAALSWHLVVEPGRALNSSSAQSQRIPLRAGERPAELVLLPLDAGPPQSAPDGTSTLSVLVPSRGNQLQAASVLLSGPWVGAQVTADKREIRIVKGRDEVRVPR